MNGRRVLAVLAVAALLALAGCSTGGDATTTAPGEVTTTAPADATPGGTADATTTADTTPDGTADATTTAPADATTTAPADGSSDRRDDEDAGDGDSSSTDGSDGEDAGGGQSDSESGETALDVPETTPVDVAAGTVRSDAVEAVETVESYRADVNQSVRTASNNVVRRVEVEQTIAVNRVNLTYRVESTQSLPGRTVETDQYLVDGAVYTRGQGNVQAFGAEWTRLDVSDNVTRTFRQQDKLRRARQHLTNATLSVLGGATVDGSPVYVLRADFNESAYAEVRGLDGIATVHNVSGVYYVDQASGRLQRLDVAANWTLSVRGRSLDQRIDTTYRFEYVGVSITLPEAADAAVDITDRFGDNESDAGNGTDDASTGEDGDHDDQQGDGSDGASADDAAGIEVRNGSLPFDPDRQFRRVEAALGTNVTDPAAVIIEEPLNRTGAGNTSLGFRRGTLGEVLGLTVEPVGARNLSVGSLSIPVEWVALTRVGGFGNVYLQSSPAMPPEFVRMLATHEFTHYVQIQNRRFAQLRSATDATTDGRYAAGAVIEGAAVFTTDSIFAANGSTDLLNSDLYAGLDGVVSFGSRNAYANGRYVQGADYVESRIDDPAALPSVYASPPTTSEQVLHGLAPGEEPPVPMTVSVEVGEEYVVAATDRKGEAFLRHALASGVSRARAMAAANGWGNDSLRTLRPVDGGNSSFVWTLRWDDAGEAEDFLAVARDYLEGYGRVANGTTTLDGRPVTLRRPGARTTVLVIGPASLQDRLSVAVDGREVVVSG